LDFGSKVLWSIVKGLRFGVQGSGFGVWGSRDFEQSHVIWGLDSGFEPSGLGFGFGFSGVGLGLGFRV